MEIARDDGTRTDLPDAEIDALSATFLGELLRPASPAYETARIVYNGVFRDRRPAIIARCRGAADVVDVIGLAARHRLLVAVRGGGHSVAGKSTCDGGLVIDLSEMRSVRVDRAAGTVRVGGGATWADVDRETQAFGLATPGGVVSGTGVAGLTLGGGLGWLKNRYGLSCDNLVSADVATADGRLLTVDEETNADLFWAIRGGGGNFGLVTSFEFAAHPVGPQVAALFPIYPVERLAEVARSWRDWVVATPDEVSAELVVWTMPAEPHYPEAAHGRVVVIPGAVHAGSVDKGTAELAPLREFGGVLGEVGGAMPFRMVQSAFDPYFPKTGEVSSYWKSLFLDDVDDGFVDALVECAGARPGPWDMLVIEHLGGAVRRVASDATAFAMRDAPFLVNLMGNWRGDERESDHVAWVRESWSRMRPRSTGAVYVNFLGRDEREERALVRAAMGPNHARLAEIKQRYDPSNLFRLNANIEPGGRDG